jgi:hypothetical protein
MSLGVWMTISLLPDHHLTDFNSGDEVTVAVYTVENLASFDEESRQVINGKP